MDWQWVLAQTVVAMLVWYFAAARSRSSMQTYADELRRAAREMSLQSQQLSSARKAAKESKHESQRRAQELNTLHDRVAMLSKENAALVAERDNTATTVQSLKEHVTQLEAQLQKAERRADQLRKEVEAASVVRLELQSRLRTDERLAALSRLRRPLPPVSPQGGVVSPLAKSPSESMLWNMHPDINLSDEEEEVKEGRKNFRDLGERMERLKREMEVPVVRLGQAAVSAGEKRLPRETERGLLTSSDNSSAKTGQLGEGSVRAGEMGGKDMEYMGGHRSMETNQMEEQLAQGALTATAHEMRTSATKHAAGSDPHAHGQTFYEDSPFHVLSADSSTTEVQYELSRTVSSSAEDLKRECLRIVSRDGQESPDITRSNNIDIGPSERRMSDRDINEARRKGRSISSLSSSYDSLSLDRPPWLDTLAPGLHPNNSGHSLASALRSSFGKSKGKGIIASSTKADK